VRRRFVAAPLGELVSIPISAALVVGARRCGMGRGEVWLLHLRLSFLLPIRTHLLIGYTTKNECVGATLGAASDFTHLNELVYQDHLLRKWVILTRF
jgi:hypothetical protein